MLVVDVVGVFSTLVITVQLVVVRLVEFFAFLRRL